MNGDAGIFADFRVGEVGNLGNKKGARLMELKRRCRKGDRNGEGPLDENNSIFCSRSIHGSTAAVKRL